MRGRLPQGHPLRARLRPGHLALGARHALIRAELRPLLAAWARGGIPALLFKGFALAEFEYATPGERFYGDVDVLLPADPAAVTRAVHLALAQGWRSDGQHARPGRWTHESAHLYSPGGHTRLDVHRFVTAWAAGRQDRVLALTRAVWAGARPVDWEGVPVWRPDPRDAVVVNLALGRQWGGDLGSLKPADYPDMRRLIARHGLTARVLEARARELGATHTWAAFRGVCDPLRGQFALEAPATRPTLQRAVWQDGLRPVAVLWQSRWKVLPRRLRWLPALLPDVLAARGAVRAGGDPRGHLARWTPPRPVRLLPLDTLEDVIGGVSWLTRLLYPRQSRVGTCVPRAYATYRALRRLGHPAVFVSGVARSGPKVQGHAWIEDARGTLDAYGEPLSRERFPEVFRYPDR
ncbi:lasso peptide biosynthesis B2 protein [Deinococcus aluminii]|uniref:Microcin J25-processing protein McjB C-terminal domain-containing protein n=1 Tax=Deinococcus aluminii TaxID=1656885 RepID=A0ABP9XDV4_9DEIO